MNTINQTSFFPLYDDGAIHGNFSKVEYEVLERSATGLTKAKFLSEILPSPNAPSIKEFIPEFFYIDSSSHNILNEDSTIIATTNILKKR